MTTLKNPDGTMSPDLPPRDGGKTRLAAVTAAVLVAAAVAVTVFLKTRGGEPTPPAAATQPAAALEPPRLAFPKPGKLLGKPDLAATADDMLAKFHADKDAADAAYADKVIDVTGEVFQVPREELGIGWFVGLGGGAEQFAGVRCRFPAENVPQLTGLEGGTKVTIRGRYDGHDSNLLLRDCAILEPEK